MTPGQIPCQESSSAPASKEQQLKAELLGLPISHLHYTRDGCLDQKQHILRPIDYCPYRPGTRNTRGKDCVTLRQNSYLMIQCVRFLVFCTSRPSGKIRSKNRVCSTFPRIDFLRVVREEVQNVLFADAVNIPAIPIVPACILEPITEPSAGNPDRNSF